MVNMKTEALVKAGETRLDSDQRMDGAILPGESSRSSAICSSHLVGQDAQAQRHVASHAGMQTD